MNDLIRYDLVLKGGRVVDPAQGLDKVTDIAFSGGKVAAIGDNLQGKDIRPVAGKIVVPGLIDLHTHVYWGGTSLGVEAESREYAMGHEVNARSLSELSAWLEERLLG